MWTYVTMVTPSHHAELLCLLLHPWKLQALKWRFNRYSTRQWLWKCMLLWTERDILLKIMHAKSWRGSFTSQLQQPAVSWGQIPYLDHRWNGAKLKGMDRVKLWHHKIEAYNMKLMILLIKIAQEEGEFYLFIGKERIHHVTPFIVLQTKWTPSSTVSYHAY